MTDKEIPTPAVEAEATTNPTDSNEQSTADTANSSSDQPADPSTPDGVSEDAEEAARKTFENWKQMCRHCINTFRDEQCNIQESLKWYEKLLGNYINNVVFNDEYRKFILDHFLEDSCTALMKREHIHWQTHYDNADLIANCCKLLVSIAVPLIKDDHPLAFTIIYYCLNAGNTFFRTFGLDWRERKGYDLSQEEEAALEEWRSNEIVEGEYVDYLFNNRWKYGQIKRVVTQQDPKTNQVHQILAIQPQMVDIWPMYIRQRGHRGRVNTDQEYTENFHLNARTKGQIAKPLTKSVEQMPHMMKWRQQLTCDEEADEKMRKCDVLDSVRKWYTTTILQIDPGANKFKIRYDGWSPRYDEWVCRDERKVQPLMSHATGGRESQGVQGDIDDIKQWEDEEDPDDASVFAVYRGKMNDHSFHLVDIMNEFGRRGGFDALTQRLSNHEPNMPVRNLRFIISPLSKAYQMYSKNTAADFIPKMHKFTFETLESLSDVELRDLRKDFLERIVGSVEVFLGRFESPDKIAEIVETFQLKMVIRRLKCATIERRVNGVQYIADICSRTRRHGNHYQSYQIRFITPDYLMNWIEENKLLEILFGKKSHPQLMKQSVDVLKFICQESKLTLDHLETIWTAIERAAAKQDDVENELQTLCEVIDNLSYWLDTEHFDFLFTKFEEIDMKTFTTHHLKLMSALSKNTTKNHDPPQRVLDILWNVVQDESGCEESIVTQAKTLIKDCLSSMFSQDLRFPTMQKCVENVAAHKSSVSSLQLMQKIVELYPAQSHMQNEILRSAIIAMLHEDVQLLDQFFNDVRHFKETAQKVMGTGTGTGSGTATESKDDESVEVDESKRFQNDEEMNAMTVGLSKMSYLNQIQERLKFLQFVLSQCPKIKLTEDHAVTLWDSFVVKALTLKERELTFKAFQKMIRTVRPIRVYLQEGVAANLFTKKMMMDIRPESMTKDSYECFEKYFVHVNCQANHLQMLEFKKSFMVNSYDDLIGLDMLWNVALLSTNELVHKKSTGLINKICNQVSAELKSEIGRLRSTVLKKIMGELQASLKAGNAEKSERVLNLLHHFLNASESRGMGGLRPHNALSRGKKWHLTIIDKVHHSGYGRPPTLKISIHENDSLWDLRRAIAKEVNSYPELLRLFYRGTRMDEDKNSLAVQQLNIRDRSSVTCMKRDDKTERVPLTTGSGIHSRLVQPARDALKEIFGQFASNEDGTMCFDDMKRYILKCGAGENSASKDRIQSIFNQYMPGLNSEYLSLEGFYKFYYAACIDRVDHVWNDLSVFKYRYDLRREDEARAEEEALMNANPETLPRHILTTNNEYFDILFKQCLQSKSSKIQEMAWKLILRLPTNPGRKAQTMSLDGDVNWEALLPSDNLFSLSYGVLICESLAIEPESALSEQELDERANWREAFLKHKGFEHLIKVLNVLSEQGTAVEVSSAADSNLSGSTTEKTTRQLALTAVLRMVQTFFVSAISCNQSMGDVISQIQSMSLGASDEKKEESKEPKSKAPKPKKRKSYGSQEIYGVYSSYADTDDDDDDEEDDKNDNEDFTALLVKQFEDAVMKASGMPESMYKETQNDWDQLEGIGGEGSGNGVEYGPHLPGQQPGVPPGASTTTTEEKDGKEEKGPPDAVEDMDVDQIAVDKALPEDQDEVDLDGDAVIVGSVKPTTLKKQTSVRKFHEMIEATTTQYADDLIKSLDFPKLMKQLLNILKGASADQAPTAQRDLVVRYAVRLWVSVLLYRPALLLDLFEFLRKDPSFMLAAIQSTDPELGMEFAKSIRKLCRYVDESPGYKSNPELQAKLPGIEIVKFFLEEILLNNLPKADNEDIDPEQHFFLLVSLMQEYGDKYGGSVSEFQDLFKYLTTELKSYTSLEKFDAPGQPDKVLVGLMTLLSVLLAGHKPYREACGQNGIVEELMKNFLFATGKTEQDKKLNLPKCKTHTAREMAYRLVVQCVMDVPSNYDLVGPHLLKLHALVKTPPAWEYCPEKSVKSERGFVGLKNLGSTCYMNSLLQQFYMIPHFRHALIKSGVAITAKMTEEEQKDSLLFQMMKMFSFLSLSEKQAFDTIGFCRSYKDETGRPVDVRIQQDAQEFFTILADRVETEVKGTEYRYLLQDVFGAQVVHQMICQGGCNKTRERKQPMPMISLPIKNRANMAESLEAFVQAETLDGVQCDHCGKKCQTLKRQVLHTLPNTVFFHLKRFELNFETFRHEKSNARFEFPEEFDLEPYTREGLKRVEKEKNKDDQPAAASSSSSANNDNGGDQKQDGGDNAAPAPVGAAAPSSGSGSEEKKDGTEKYSVHPKEYYQYELKGIVVHTGSAEAGHYYSYIKDRATGEWNEFNDSLIKTFDVKFLDNDCFGGKKKWKSSQNWGTEWEHDQEKIKNAYILVYDRKEYQPPVHPEDIKKQEEEEAKKRAAENVGTPEAKQSENESKQEQDNKEDGDGDDSSPKGGDGGGGGGGGDDEETKKDESPLPPPIDIMGLFDANVQDFVMEQPTVWGAVLDTNMKFMRDRQLFNMQYFTFIYNLICVAPVTSPSGIGSSGSGSGGGGGDENDNDDAKDTDSGATDGGLEVLKMATKVCFRLLARTADKRMIFNRFLTYLKFLYQDNVIASKWLLEYLSSQRQYVEQYILMTRDTLVMHGFSDMVIHALRQLKDVEAEQLMETETVIRKVPARPMQQYNNQYHNQQQQMAQNQQFVDQEFEISKCASSKMMDLMIDLIQIAHKHWFRFSHFFRVFLEYALMGHHQRNYLIDKGLIAQFGDFYMGTQSPYSDRNKRYPVMGNRMYPPKFDTIIQIISLLLCSCHSPSSSMAFKKTQEKWDELNDDQKEMMQKVMKSPVAMTWKDADTGMESLHVLSEMDRKLPHCRQLYDNMIKEAHSNAVIMTAVSNLFVHWGYEDQHYSREVVNILTEGIDHSGADQVKTFLAIMHRFIMVEDSQRDFRLKQLHDPDPVAISTTHHQHQGRHNHNRDKKNGVLGFIKCYRQNHQPFSYECIKALTSMMMDNDYYATYMVSKRADWTWWDAWLDNYVHRPSYIHNQESQLQRAQKIAFYKEQYIPLLAKYGIECQRSQLQQQHGHQMGNMHYNRGFHSGGVDAYVHDNYVGVPGGQYDDDDEYMNGQHQNSPDDEIYDNNVAGADDHDVNEGAGAGAPGDEESGDDEQENNTGDQDMQIADEDEDEDDVDLVENADAGLDGEARAEAQQPALDPV